MQQFNTGYKQDVEIDSILPVIKATTPKQVLQELSEAAALKSGTNAQQIFEILAHKEERESSGVGQGIAIPHAKIRHLPHPVTVLARLATPVSFDSVDEHPVDIACLILSPEREGPLHLRRLSRLSRLLKNKELHSKIVETNDGQTIRSLLMDPDGWTLAA